MVIAALTYAVKPLRGVVSYVDDDLRGQVSTDPRGQSSMWQHRCTTSLYLLLGVGNGFNLSHGHRIFHYVGYSIIFSRAYTIRHGKYL